MQFQTVFILHKTSSYATFQSNLDLLQAILTTLNTSDRQGCIECCKNCLKKVQIGLNIAYDNVMYMSVFGG